MALFGQADAVQKFWTLVALVLIGAIFYRVVYDVPHNTCNDIWLQAERRQNDPVTSVAPGF